MTTCLDDRCIKAWEWFDRDDIPQSLKLANLDKYFVLTVKRDLLYREILNHPEVETLLSIFGGHVLKYKKHECGYDDLRGDAWARAWKLLKS